MPNAQPNEKLKNLFDKAYQSLGRSVFVYLSPYSQIAQSPKALQKFDKNFQKQYKKHKNLIDTFVNATSELPQVEIPTDIGDNLGKNALTWLKAQNAYYSHQMQQALPVFAEYALEFFLPPMTAEHVAEAKAYDLDEIELETSIKINMPHALKMNTKGEFDMLLTQKSEGMTYLIKSRLSSLKLLEYPAKKLANELKDYPDRAFFIGAHGQELEDIAEELVLRVYDSLMHFVYNDVDRGLPPAQAKENGYAQLQALLRDKQLNELVVFRAPEDVSLDIYVLELLNSIREINPRISQETIKDYYTHVFKSLEKIITANLIIPGTILYSEIRQSTKEERNQEGNDYTVEIQQVLESGNLLDGVKEWYKVVLSDESTKNLILYATNQHQLEEYFI